MSKITRKTYKRKKILMGAILFGAVGLVSTGFAAWVLSSSVTENQAASLSVGVVDDKNMEFKNVTVVTTGSNPEAENNIYHFEPKAGDTAGRVRLGGDQAELLSLTVKGEIWHTQNLGSIKAEVVTIANGNDDQATGYISAETAASNLATAVTRGYVTNPSYYGDETEIWSTAGVATDLPSAVLVSDDVVIDAQKPGDMKRTFSVEVKFAWGSLFGSDNPSVYFDSAAGKDVPQGTGADVYDGQTAELATVAGYLNEMHNLLDTVSIKLILTADPS